MGKNRKNLIGIMVSTICLTMVLCSCVGENSFNDGGLSGDIENDVNGTPVLSDGIESNTQNSQEADTPPNTAESDDNKTDPEVLHFAGEINVEGRTEALDLSFYEKSYHIQYYFVLNVLGDTIVYDIRDYCMPETIKEYTLVDMNADGNDDIIIDLGVYGHIRYAVCYLYDKETEKYIPLEGFDELENPHLSKNHEYVLLEERHLSAPEYVINKYRVEDQKLILIGSLYWYYPKEVPFGTSGGPRYTERELRNGEMVIIKENVLEEEIDFSFWQ